MDLRSQLAALFGRGEQVPQQPDSPMVARVPTGTPGQMLDQYGQVVDENALGEQNEEGLITKQNEDFVNRSAGRRPPVQDQASMDALMMQLANPDAGITEGPNANIGDDSRARALAQIAALRG